MPPKPYYEDSAVKIYHGDCRVILPHLEPVDLVLTDPPYGVGRKYGPSYDDSRAMYWDWFLPTLSQMRKAGKVMAMHHLLFVLKRVIDWDWIIAWHKSYGAGARIGNSPVLPHWEPILVWGIHSLGTKREVLQDWISCNPERSPRKQESISPRDADDLDSAEHPLPKPLALEKKLIKALCNNDSTILDPFMGNGTTLRAAKDLGRKAIGIEIEEKYAEIAAKRMMQEVLPLDVKPETKDDEQRILLP